MSATASSATNVKPSLSGVRIKARKGAVKASAKHEPSAFRDQLFKYLETVPQGDFDGFANKLIVAGASLEFSKYSDALFEILFVGGILQHGGTLLDDGAPLSPFYVGQVSGAEVQDLKKYVEVFSQVIRRYKYLQKPLEDHSLPSLLQYSAKWTEDQKSQITTMTGLLICQGYASAGCLVPLTNDQLVKNDIALNLVTKVFKTMLAEQNIDAFATNLKKGNIKDILLFFPLTKRDTKHLELHFKEAGLPQIVDWYVKRQNARVREAVTGHLKEMVAQEESSDAVIDYLKTSQSENPLPEPELVHCIWQSMMSTVDWSIARPDQVEAMVLKEVKRISVLLAPFCTSPRTQVALINVVQVYCYEDQKIIKTFTPILKVLYNEDCVTDNAIIYWYQKGAKPQGKQHFLKATESLVKFLQEEEESEEDDE